MPIPDLETLARRAADLPADAVPADLTARWSVVVEGREPWTVSIDAGEVSVEPGADGDVVLHLDAETAEAVHDGRLNAQRAIALGRLRIQGDLDTLPSARALAAVGALLGPRPA